MLLRYFCAKPVLQQLAAADYTAMWFGFHYRSAHLESTESFRGYMPVSRCLTILWCKRSSLSAFSLFAYRVLLRALAGKLPRTPESPEPVYAANCG